MVLNKLHVFFLLMAIVGTQIFALSHSVEVDAHQHEHTCPLCLSADQNDQLSLFSIPSVQPTIPAIVSNFDVGTSFTPAFQANFFGRAPPASPLA